MQTKILSIESENNTTNLELQFDSILRVYKFFTDENDIETRILIFTQPYKTNPDGVNTEWQSAEEAFEWFEEKSKEMM